MARNPFNLPLERTLDTKLQDLRAAAKQAKEQHQNIHLRRQQEAILLLQHCKTSRP